MDFNNDGWIDVALSALDETPTLLMNQAVPGNHWILVGLSGSTTNRLGVGARITVKTASLTQVREIKAGGSYASSNDPRAHFGVGSATTIEELSVQWPSGKVSRLTNVETDRILTIRE